MKAGGCDAAYGVILWSQKLDGEENDVQFS